MNLMDIVNLLNPFKFAWYRKGEWVKVDDGICVRIVAEHDCPSWDVKFVRCATYRNKETCEERTLKDGHLSRLWDKTVWEDPRESKVSLFGEEWPHMGEIDFYEGSKYD